MSRVLSALLVCVFVITAAMPMGAHAAPVKTAVPEATCAADAESYNIYPIPQQVTYAGGSFAPKAQAAIVTGEGVDTYTVDYLKEVLTDYQVGFVTADAPQAGKLNILLGVKGSAGAAADYVQQNVTVKKADLFQQNDAYLLTAKDNTIVIQGRDTDSVFHGVSTLKMMFSSFAGEKLLNTQIEDFATVAKRGYIEGFYGAWNFEERENLMRFARDYKMNSYVYAAKGDSYHTSAWDQLYPKAQLDQLANLVQVGKETKVEFAWSIHLGNFFNGLNDGNQADRYKKLTNKLDQLIGIGVKQIDVLNDDFGGGSHTKVVEILNQLNAYLKSKGCGPLTYCPQGYNIAWSQWSQNQSELPAMKNLDPDIHVYWTGHDVNSPITQDSVDYLVEKSGHAPDFWLNYPVNEHAKSGIYLGDITHYARDGVTGLAGFHSNPSRYAYANEVGLYQLAALVWNNGHYSDYAQEVWESAFDYLQPEVRDEYFTIARNVANAPGSGRVPQGFPESEYLRQRMDIVLDRAQSGATLARSAAAASLLEEFQDIDRDVISFRANCNNQDLVLELDPWLSSLTDLVRAGSAALESLIALEEEDPSTGWTKLSEASKYFDTVYQHKLVGEGLDGVAKAGSKLMYPFVSSLINVAKNTLGPILNPGDNSVDPVAYVKMGGQIRTDDDNTRKMYDGDPATYATWQTVQQVVDYYGLDLGRVITLRDVEVLQGMDDNHHDIFHKARLEYSEDGKTWTTLVDNSAGTDAHVIKAEGLNVKARYVRYCLTGTGYGSKGDYWTYVREFTVNREVPRHDRIYTNVDSLKTTPLTLNGAEVSVKGLNGITLNKGEYVGIKLVDPTTVTAFVKDVSSDALTLQYSYNGAQWTEAGALERPVGVGYLRLVNLTNAPVQADVAEIGMTLKQLRAQPTLASTSTAGLAQGSWENVFDGDLGTFVLTRGGQQANTDITFDLGKVIEIHDVTAVMTDGAERLYNAKIQVSMDNAQWQDVVTVANDNTEFPGPPHRFARGNGNGTPARYLRILFTGSNSSALKLYELQLNRNVESGTAADPVVSTLSGNLNALCDGDIATLFQSAAQRGDTLEYRVQGNANITQVSVLQAEGSNAKLYVNGKGGRQLLGNLDESVNIFDTSKYAPVSSFVIEWTGSEQAAIYELTASAGADLSGDVGQYVEPVIESAGPAPFTNVIAQTTVTVSGTSDGNKDNVKDGDPNTKWDSDFIKNNGADSGDAWLQVDLGAGKNWEINKLVISFFNKIYPTSWKIETSNNAQQWQELKTFTSADNGPTNPVSTVELETPVSARYVRFYFNTLNTAAAGNGVGVKDVEIYAREKQAGPQVDVAALEALIASAQPKTQDVQYTEASRQALTEAVAHAQQVAAAPESANQVAAEQTALQTAVGGLTLKITAAANIALNKPVTVSGKELDSVDEHAINDGNADTKWDSQHIKTGDNPDTGDAWFVIDLGETTSLIDSMKISFFNKVYPTLYRVELSNDNRSWTVVQTVTKAHDGPAHPVDNFTFDAPLSARYVRFYFEKLNTAAAGHGVAVKECEIQGRYVNETASVKGAASVADVTVDKGAALTLPALAQITASAPDLSDMQVQVPVAWNTEAVDLNTANTYAVTGALSLNGIRNPQNVAAQVNVVVRETAAADEVTAAGGEEKAESKALFTDVAESDYFHQPVLWGVENKVTSGISADQFGPHRACTRGEIVTFLWSAAGKPEPASLENPFTDVKESDYFCKAALWAAEQGITAGSGATTFSPEQVCSRAQAMTFLYAYQGKPAAEAELTFTDVAEDDYFCNAVKWAVSNHITAGVAEDAFGSDADCSRAQIITFLYLSLAE